MEDNMRRCKNCGAPIYLAHYSSINGWMHYKPGSSFMDSDYRYCRITVAEPVAK